MTANQIAEASHSNPHSRLGLSAFHGILKYVMHILIGPSRILVVRDIPERHRQGDVRLSLNPPDELVSVKDLLHQGDIAAGLEQAEEDLPFTKGKGARLSQSSK